MTLEDFEKYLAEEKTQEARELSHRKDRQGERSHRHRKHRHHEVDVEYNHRHKRRKHSKDIWDEHDQSAKSAISSAAKKPAENDERLDSDVSLAGPSTHPKPSSTTEGVKRDSWMEAPSALDIDYTQRGMRKTPEKAASRSSKATSALKIHENELNKYHLQDLADGKELLQEMPEDSSPHEVDYIFGDAGAAWRMTKLKGVYRRAEEEGRDVDDVAKEQYGDLGFFDNAREEQTELERREMYGKGYVGKERPSGDLFAERKVEVGVSRPDRQDDSSQWNGSKDTTQTELRSPQPETVAIDQTSLNRLKAKLLKAKIKGGPEVARTEAEYNTALANFANQEQSGVVVLGAMENRMLARGRQGEVKAVDNRRGRERGMVEENEDMTIEDMIREERRTRGQAGGDGRRFAERIAKDGKFDNDLNYMDENAAKLAKRVQKSEISLRNTAISDLQKISRALDKCPLCHHEDTNTPPVAPLVSLATRIFLTLPTEPEIADGGASIVPIQHRGNLLECDDDEWEEIRNFMKSLTRMYHDQGRDVIFYENAAAPYRRKHAAMEVVPLPYSLGETAPAFFKEAILTADEEWTQHKKIIDTIAKAKNGLGRSAFRRTLAKEMPYFHVWFELDGGLGHVVEDSNRWPRGDLFAREILGGMLDRGPDVIRRQGKWTRGRDPRVDGFRKHWKKFDWTRVLTDSGSR